MSANEKRWEDVGKVKRKVKKTKKTVYHSRQHQKTRDVVNKCKHYHQWLIHFSTDHLDEVMNCQMMCISLNSLEKCTKYVTLKQETTLNLESSWSILLRSDKTSVFVLLQICFYR